MYNNGDGVPVEVHKEEGVYVPELIFGHLLTSSNYNDDEKKVDSTSSQSCRRASNLFCKRDGDSDNMRVGTVTLAVEVTTRKASKLSRVLCHGCTAP